MLGKLLFLVSSGPYLATAECPYINTLPILMPNGQDFLCARGWQGGGAESEIQVCQISANFFLLH